MTNTKLTFKQFWELSEIYTAPLNLFIILLGISSANYLTTTALSINLTIFIAIIISFHIAVNIFNNWMDYQNAEDKNYKEVTNIIGRDNLAIGTVKKYFYSSMIVSFILGAYLVSQTNLMVGILGFIGFYIGLFYSYGKYPLNSLPIAETITAIASGFFITFISFYLMTFETSGANKSSLLSIIAISLPLVISMFNNLLANNTCDLEEDIRNHRYTLVYYIGKKNALKLYFVLASLPWLLWLLYCLTGFLPFWALIGLLGLVPAYHSLERFLKKQVKRETFIEAVKSFVLFSGVYVLTLLVALIFNK